MRRACARALSSRSFFQLEQSFQPTPSPLCGLASWPLLGACPMYPGEVFLTFDLFDQVETICEAKALSTHSTSGYFSIADTGSNKPTNAPRKSK